MRVLIASGGTGGHIFPAISVAEEIKSRTPDAEFLFIGAERRALNGLRFADEASVVRLPAIGMPRKPSVDFATFAWRLLISLGRSVRCVARFRPHVALGFGNFGSFPPLLAAKLLGVPIAIHEANAIPGKANIVLSRLSDRVLVNFPGAVRHFPGGNVELVGMPLRKEFKEPRKRLGALAKLKLSGTKFTLLVIGGSQGARALNTEVCNQSEILRQMSEKVQLIHLTGKSDYSWVKRRYRESRVEAYVAPFDSRMKLLFDAADLVLARAGASTLAEIIETGKPAILVPFPYATARHQDENARYLEENGGAVVLKEESMSSGRASIPGLGSVLRELIEDNRRLQEMAENTQRLASGHAARRIVDVLFTITRPEVATCRGLRRRVVVPA